MKKDTPSAGYGFGTFQGVFTPSILTIIGVVMYLRFGWMLGNVGLVRSLLLVVIGSSITFLTGLSISALATNMRMKGGGAYFMLSRSLGLETGAALGIPLALSQAIGVSFYVAGFAEALVNSGLPMVSGWSPQTVGLVTLAVLATVSSLSADIALKSQYFIMAAIAFSLVSFFLGGTPEELTPPAPADVPAPLGFWPVFAVFFPAVTGILSGLGMSGDLKDPAKSIPRGTLAAVLVGFAIYMAVPIALDSMVTDSAVLRTDTMILQKCARWQMPILIGVWAATLSSAVGSFLCAPRVLQALSRDRLLPSFFGRGFGTADDPRFASLFCFGVAAAGIALGDINILAPVLTLFNLSTYGLLNLTAACEELMSNPTWRPSFRVKAGLSFVGFAGCIAAMFMISPGWTFVALACEAGIYWYVKRRALRARWGDMRTGLMAAMVRFAFRRLAHYSGYAERNWRPNLLVMTRLPIQNKRMLELAREISDGRSLVTLASVLPEEMNEAGRTAELRDSILRTSEKMDLEAEVKLLSMSNDWAGMAELIRSYGFGPIVPNTVVLGLPEERNVGAFSGIVKQLAENRKNLIAVGNGGDEGENADGRHIDIWWRGSSNGNGGLMLALAYLMQRSGSWSNRKLRVNMIVRRRTPDEAAAELAEFLRDARLQAETRIITSDGRPFIETINANSEDAACTFIGLRAPAADEADESYGAYLSALRFGVPDVPAPVFVLAAENIDFRRIFA